MQWASSNVEDSLGTLNIKSVIPQGGSKAVHQISVQLSNVDTSNPNEIKVTDEYTLDEITTTAQMLAFGVEENKEQGDCYFVKGKVSKLYALRPRGSTLYKQVLQNRVNNKVPVKELKPIEPSKVMQNYSTALEVNFIPPACVDSKRKNAEWDGLSKRARASDVSEVRTKVIKAFTQKEHLTLKEIIGFCQSNTNDIKELLGKLTVFHRKGPLKNYYELKPEYKSSSSSNSNSSSGNNTMS